MLSIRPGRITRRMNTAGSRNEEFQASLAVLLRCDTRHERGEDAIRAGYEARTWCKQLN